jgi:hypothetical protein
VQAYGVLSEQNDRPHNVAASLNALSKLFSFLGHLRHKISEKRIF